jgi:hypothetical protein
MINGSCLCGAVTYEAEELAGPVVHCHCRTCQKAHSAAFATTARVAREAFRWTRGAESLSAYPSSPGKLRRFCSQCGSQMISEWLHEPWVILRMATVEAGLTVEPECHIWTSLQAPWDHGHDDLARYPEGRPA